jgi:hypothetical protein
VALTEAGLLLAQHRPVPAREQLSRAVAAFDAASDKSPLRIRALAQLARAESQAGDTAAASSHAATAVAAAREAAKGFASTQWLGEALVARGVVRKAAGEQAESNAALREAVVQLEGSIGADAPQTREARLLVGAP